MWISFICKLISFQEHGLYYDGTAGCYYRLNQETNEFVFHSQVYSQQTDETTKQVELLVKNHLINILNFLDWF